MRNHQSNDPSNTPFQNFELEIEIEDRGIESHEVRETERKREGIA